MKVFRITHRRCADCDTPHSVENLQEQRDGRLICKVCVQRASASKQSREMRESLGQIPLFGEE